MDVLLWLKTNHDLAVRGVPQGIIPMVLIPLTAVTVGMTSVAGIIAGWFGIKLHTEGPKQFLEVLLKKRVLVSMLVFNFFSFAAYKSYVYVRTLPSFTFTINRHSDNESVLSKENYSESLYRSFNYEGKINPVSISGLKLEKETQLKMGSFRSGLISGNSIFYGVDDGNIYEINKNSLEVKRKFFIGTQVTTRPIIYKNRLYSGEGNHNTHHARAYAFDLATGKFINAFSTKGHTEGQPLIAEYKGKTLLFVTAGADGLYAVDPISMQEAWHQIDGHLDATVTVKDGIVYTGTGIEKGSSADKRFAVAYEFLTGKIIWKKELPLSNWMHPVVTADSVCYALGEIYYPSNVGFLHCLDRETGDAKLSMPFNAPVTSKPYYLKEGAEEYVFVGDFHGEICGIHLNTKEKMWCHKTGDEKVNHAFSSFDFDPAHGVLLYPSYNNGLFMIEPKSGRIVSHINSDWKENYAAVSIEGDNVYHMDIDGHLKQFKVQP